MQGVIPLLPEMYWHPVVSQISNWAAYTVFLVTLRQITWRNCWTVQIFLTLYTTREEVLESIEGKCKACQTYAQKPRRVKFKLRDDKEINHTIYEDIFYIEGKPILHIVGKVTNFQSAKWLEDMIAEILWQSVRICLIDIYLEPPDFISHNSGENFTASAFQSNADMLHIQTEFIPVESVDSMTIDEQHHAPFWRAYNIIRKEASYLDKNVALQRAVKAINDSIWPDAIVPANNESDVTNIRKPQLVLPFLFIVMKWTNGIDDFHE